RFISSTGGRALRFSASQRRSSGRFDMDVLDLTPLVDVVFLLLIFFLLASNLETRRLLPIDLPDSAAGVTSADMVLRELSIDAAGEVTLDGAAIRLEDTAWREL